MESDNVFDKQLDRQSMIMDAGFEVFLNYGFKRTSMDDIAKVAEISRPALYKSFGNKSEIFRALIVRQMELVGQELQNILDKNLPLGDVLNGMFETAVLEPHRMLKSMRHGEEFLGVKNLLAPDLFEQWAQQSHDAYRAALLHVDGMDENLAGDLATMISNVVHGIKARNIDIELMEKEMAGLQRVVVIAASAQAR